ncbi:unnamed protein product [Linum trigynum]|uniref:Uncharacterized protein n=1 Tax=Linum trigynum TaxID=586398 RepID=A0AAV2EPM8_9ROSI
MPPTECYLYYSSSSAMLRPTPATKPYVSQALNAWSGPTSERLHVARRPTLASGRMGGPFAYVVLFRPSSAVLLCPRVYFVAMRPFTVGASQVMSQWATNGLQAHQALGLDGLIYVSPTIAPQLGTHM